MVLVDSRKLSGIVRRTLGYVDGRLVEHGERVACIVLRLLRSSGKYQEKEIRNYCFLALIHDIGAYKTEEIDNMVHFETGNVWNHSVYGYLFIKHLSSLPQYASIILYHHTDYQELERLGDLNSDIAQIFNIADRMDVYWSEQNAGGENEFLKQYEGGKFSKETIALFSRANQENGIYNIYQNPSYMDELLEVLGGIPFTQTEIHKTLSMLVSAIDFRSYYTVIHTITTTSISIALGKVMGLSEEQLDHIYYGAMLHDLGKIGVPVEILEYPGKLSTQAMNVMKEHVNITEKIMGDEIDPEVVAIALRHHEKLNGMGYPRGLSQKELTVSERIVAIADIISALNGERSYKEAYDKDSILTIIQEQAKEGFLDKSIVETAVEHFDTLLEYTKEQSIPFLQLYHQINKEYLELMRKYSKVPAQI